MPFSRRFFCKNEKQFFANTQLGGNIEASPPFFASICCFFDWKGICLQIFH